MKLTIRILLGLVLVVALFDLVVAELARRECEAPPGPDEDWIVNDQLMLPPDGEPARRTVILIHGFGGSPLDFKPLAAPLTRAGFRVVIPVTPGQGRDVHAYRRKEITPEMTLRWLRGLIRAETLRAGGVKPHIVGFSMGGTLVTVVAAENLVDRVVLLGPFYSLPSHNDLIRTVAGLVAPVVPVFPKPWRGNIADPAGYEQYRPGSWYISIGAFLRLEELADQARVAATTLTRPTLLLGSRNDFAASFEVSRELFGGNDAVTIHEFPRSDHILLYDYDREEVIRMVVEFLRAE